MNTLNFKSYSDKSSARKGAIRALGEAFGEDKLIKNEAGKWGFYPVAELSLQEDSKVDEPAVISPFVPVDSQEDTSTLAAAIEAGIAEAEEEESPHAQASAAVFAGLALSQLGAQRTETATQNVVRVEKNREECNGIKRPSAGTACANVWDKCFMLSDMSENHNVPHTRIATMSEVINACVAMGINKFTARTQYARWRVFNGITGRLVNK